MGRIRNSITKNAFGDGKEKIIVENKGGSGDDLAKWIADWLINSSPKFIRIPISIIGYAFIIGCFVTIIYGIIQFLSFAL